jgi:hypothetical protein
MTDDVVTMGYLSLETFQLTKTIAVLPVMKNYLVKTSVKKSDTIG